MDLNKFPTEFHGKYMSKALNAREKVATIRLSLMSKLGVIYGRCFREECGLPLEKQKAIGRTTKYMLNTECSKKGSEIHLHQDMYWVLFSVMKFLIMKSITNEKEIYTNFLKVFMSTGGSFEADPVGVPDPAAYKAKVPSIIDQCKRDSQGPNLRKNFLSSCTKRKYNPALSLHVSPSVPDICAHDG